MDYLNLLLADMPPGFWQNLIGYAVDFANNYGLAIIIFTIILKLILSPLDFMQRKITKENTAKQAKLKPQLEKLNEKYKEDKQKLNQKTMELYKKENYNVVGSCFGMMVNLVLTLVIFITLFGALRDIGEYKMSTQYLDLASTYEATYTQTIGDEQEKTLQAEQAVIDRYSQIKEDFLWIENIWMPDTRSEVIPDHDRFIKLTNLSEDETPNQQEYLQVMGVLKQEYSGWNGLYILIILAAGITYYSQKVMQGKLGKAKTDKKEDDSTPQVNTKFMLYLLPILMIIFTVSYSAAFALYIVMNSAMTLVISLIANKIIEKKQLQKEQDSKLEYSR
jgi:YidC/Oxa1 family membrane protein insertase